MSTSTPCKIHRTDFDNVANKRHRSSPMDHSQRRKKILRLLVSAVATSTRGRIAHTLNTCAISATGLGIMSVSVTRSRNVAVDPSLTRLASHRRYSSGADVKRFDCDENRRKGFPVQFYLDIWAEVNIISKEKFDFTGVSAL
jgi:hypothetical protein